MRSACLDEVTMRLTFRQSVSVSRGLLSGIRFDVSLYSLVFQIDNVSIKVQKNVISGYFCQLKVNLATTFHAHSGQFQVYFTLSSRRKVSHYSHQVNLWQPGGPLVLGSGVRRMCLHSLPQRVVDKVSLQSKRTCALKRRGLPSKINLFNRTFEQ